MPFIWIFHQHIEYYNKFDIIIKLRKWRIDVLTCFSTVYLYCINILYRSIIHGKYFIHIFKFPPICIEFNSTFNQLLILIDKTYPGISIPDFSSNKFYF